MGAEPREWIPFFGSEVWMKGGLKRRWRYAVKWLVIVVGVRFVIGDN
jgi:hypothetical protein